jgi:hypothetical protein
MVGGRFVFVYLAENGSLMIDGLGPPGKQAGRQASDLAGKGEFGPWQQTNRQTEIVGRGEATRSGAEITRYKSVSHFRRTRSHALKAKVTHGHSFPRRHAGSFATPEAGMDGSPVTFS